MTGTTFAEFSSAHPNLDIAFLYPSDWHPIESEEETYTQVFVEGPRNRANTYTMSLVVTVLPSQGKTLDEHVADYLARARRSDSFSLRTEIGGFLAGAPAAEFLISYRAVLPLGKIHASSTPFLERSVIVQKGERCYELTYTTPEAEFGAFVVAFENAARTFRFRDAPPEEFHPVVSAAAVLEPAHGSVELGRDHPASH